MKTYKRILAIALSAVICFSASALAFAETSTNVRGTPYSPIAHGVDNLLGFAHDKILGWLIKNTLVKNIIDEQDYVENVYEGTNSTAQGTKWSGGFASASIIPVEWRRDAQGNKDPDGKCLNMPRATGGYQTYVKKLYTDQMINMLILSNGSDSNKNGKEDIIIFASVDGVGVTSGTVHKMQSAIENILPVEKSDILSCNISATHCHAGLDTEGMNYANIILSLIFSRFLFPVRSINARMNSTIIKKAAECAKSAYENMEDGNLYFFETDRIDGCGDKLDSGVKAKNFFSCFIFEGKGENAQKTILTNIGAHPTSYGAWNGNSMLCTDYPYFMSIALKDAGYNLVFTQSSQACIDPPEINFDENYKEEDDTGLQEFLDKHTAKYEDWVEFFGQDYADTWYNNPVDKDHCLEEKIEGHMKKGYYLADFIINSIDKTVNLDPVLNVKNTQSVISLDNNLLSLGCTSGILGETVVKRADSETGYGVVVDINYIEFGGKIAVITAPFELSPALVYGTDPNYGADIEDDKDYALWTGITSWTGEDWQYDSLIDMVEGGEDNPTGKTLVFMGITNGALGYVLPDIDTPQSILGGALFYKGDENNKGALINTVLLTIGNHCASQITECFIKLLESVK